MTYLDTDSVRADNEAVEKLAKIAKKIDRISFYGNKNDIPTIVEINAKYGLGTEKVVKYERH